MSAINRINQSLSNNARVIWLSPPEDLHQTCLIPFDVFANMPIRRWRHNRPSDEDRVAEIREFMCVSKRVDGIIYLAAVGQELVCYESNHRREALVGIGNVIPDIRPILVDVIWNATDELIKNEFFRLNKAVSVPDLYIDPSDGDDGVVLNNYGSIQQFIAARDSFCRRYPSLKVTTARPQKPNFNSDNLIDDLAKVVAVNNISIQEMMRRLDVLNAKLACSDRTKLTQKVIDKCEKSGCWLFAFHGRLIPADFAAVDVAA